MERMQSLAVQTDNILLSKQTVCHIIVLHEIRYIVLLQYSAFPKFCFTNSKVASCFFYIFIFTKRIL